MKVAFNIDLNVKLNKSGDFVQMPQDLRQDLVQDLRQDLVQDSRQDLEQLERTHTALTEDFAALKSMHEDLEIDYEFLSIKFDELTSELVKVKRELEDLKNKPVECKYKKRRLIQ